MFKRFHTCRSYCLVTALATALLLSAPAIAAGGGGAAPTPSASAPKYQPAEEYRHGVAAMDAGNYSEAIRHFKRVVRAVPRNAEANFMLGLSYVGQNKDKRAIRYLRKAVKYDSNIAAARGQLGAAQARRGDETRAREQHDALAAMAEQCGDCAQADTIARAMTAIEAALAGDTVPFDLDAFRGATATDGDGAYIDALRLINQHRYDAAKELLADAAMAFGPHPDVLTYQGFVHRKTGDYAQAMTFYNAALAIAPNHLGANEYLGELYLDRGDTPAALEQLAKLDALCVFGCEESEELRRWVVAAQL